MKFYVLKASVSFEKDLYFSGFSSTGKMVWSDLDEGGQICLLSKSDLAETFERIHAIDDFTGTIAKAVPIEIP